MAKEVLLVTGAGHIAKGLAVAGTDAQNKPDKVQSNVANWLGGLGF